MTHPDQDQTAIIFRVPTQRVKAVTDALVESGVAGEAILAYALGAGQPNFETNIAGILSRQANRAAAYAYDIIPHDSRPTTLITHIPSGEVTEAITRENMQVAARAMFNGMPHIGSHLHTQLFASYQQIRLLHHTGYAIEYTQKRTPRRHALIASRARQLLEHCGVKRDDPDIQLSARALSLFQHICGRLEDA